MAMKKRVAASMAAVLVAAMCFGSTAFAADENNTPVNGTTKDVTDENTEVKMTVETAPGDPTWSVDIPLEIAFNKISVNSPDSAFEKPLKYSCAINNEGVAEDANKIKTLSVNLGSKKMYDMFRADDATTLSAVFGVLAEGDTVGQYVEANGKIVTMSPNKITGEGKVKLDKDAMKTGGVKDGNYKGNLTVVITPETAGPTS